MDNRMARVNELLKRELSQVLHTRYQDLAVSITIVDVDIAADLRHGRVYYSVLGDAANEREAARFFAEHRGELQKAASKPVTLKYFPQLTFEQDRSIERGTAVLERLDELERNGEL
jgi:ribosome-binding factor A